MQYLRMISDWLWPRGLVLTVIGKVTGKVIGKGLIGHHWKSAEKGKTAWSLGGSSEVGARTDTHTLIGVDKSQGHVVLPLWPVPMVLPDGQAHELAVAR